MSYQIYVVPYYDSLAKAWMFDILDDEEELLEQFAFATQEEALRAHRERFINDVVEGRGRGRVDQ
jgi:hypothetical protein